ncbi:hypothetical protein IU469_30865 [Nocardia puris]|uniref:hypothetical protein n=1 Tax=Nocardia puris TaxID=208602 RepID=UPI0018961194|nr:hypothetical protein [Nocardia puris]MBF6213147.1 hypothetical protein [Nocardia puris]MBF6370076.1 hypothetical protein [Nocardia puris]
MPEYTFDVYAVVTLIINAPSEAAARKMLENDHFGQELQPCGGDVQLTSGSALPLSTHLSSLSYRKVWTVPNVLDDNGSITEGSVRPSDGPVAELENRRQLYYCATEDCLNLLDDAEGWEGYCGSCADARSADETASIREHRPRPDRPRPTVLLFVVTDSVDR